MSNPLVPTGQVSTERMLLETIQNLSGATFYYYSYEQLKDAYLHALAGPRLAETLESFVDATKDALERNNMLQWKLKEEEDDDEEMVYVLAAPLEWDLYPEYSDEGNETG